MENGLMIPLSVSSVILAFFGVIYLCLLLNLGVYSWLIIASFLSPLIGKLAKENKLRWKRHIESFEPATHDWDKSLEEYIQSRKA